MATLTVVAYDNNGVVVLRGAKSLDTKKSSSL